MALWSKAKLSYTVALAVLWYFTFDLYTGQLKKGSGFENVNENVKIKITFSLNNLGFVKYADT